MTSRRCRLNHAGPSRPLPGSCSRSPLGPIGTAVFLLGFVHGESPCILCWAQRIGMALIALTGLFILRFGPRPRYVGFAILVAAFGVYMGLRHSALHVARDIGQGFSGEILGAHTNTWSLFIFWAALVVVAGLVLSLRDGQLTRRLRTLTRLRGVRRMGVPRGSRRQHRPGVRQHRAAAVRRPVGSGALLVQSGALGVVARGVGDRCRSAFAGATWCRTRRTSALDPNPAAGPFASLASLGGAASPGRLPAIDGAVTGLAYDAETDRFLVTTVHGVSLVDGGLTRRIGGVVDRCRTTRWTSRRSAMPPSSTGGTVLALSENKSYAVLRVNPAADADCDLPLLHRARTVRGGRRGAASRRCARR